MINNSTPRKRQSKRASALLLSSAMTVALAGVTGIGGSAWANDYAPHFEQIGMDDSLYQGTNLARVKVAVLDTLAQDDHEDMGHRQVRNVRLRGGTYTRDQFHGTHVSGIIGASNDGFGGQGVAAGVRIINYGMFDDNGWVPNSFDAILQNALRRRVSVSNASYGIGGGRLTHRSEMSAVARVGKNMVFVKAAGNDGVNAVDADYFGSASDLNNMLFVGSVDANNQISSFSNRPGEACLTQSGCDDADKIKHRFLVSTGENVFSTTDGSGYGFGSGTSMAAPTVTGAAALVQSRWRWLRRDAFATTDILLTSATDLGAEGVDAVYGHGLLNVRAAMNPLGDTVISEGWGGVTTTDTRTRAEKRADRRNERSARYGRKCRSADGVYSQEACLEHLRSGSSVAISSLSESSILTQSALSSAQITVFDGFGRDFAFNATALQSEMDRQKFVLRAQAQESSLDAPASANLLQLGYVSADSSHLTASAKQGLGFQAGFGKQQVLGQALGLASLGNGGHRALIDGDDTGFNPVAALAGGEAFAAASYKSAGGLSFQTSFQQTFGLTTDDNTLVNSLSELTDAERRSSLSLDAGYQVNDKLNLIASFTQLTEQNGLLGAGGSGFFAFDAPTTTNSATVGFDLRASNRISLLGSFTTAKTTQGAGRGFYLNGPLTSDAFHLGLAAKSVLAKRDVLSFGISQPLRVRSGGLVIETEQVIDRETGARGLVASNVDLSAKSRQMDMKLAYGRDFWNGAGQFEVRGEANLNEGHVSGKLGYGIGASFKVAF